MARLRLVRWVVLAVCAVGIAGMIVTSIADNTAGALTFGLVAGSAAVGLMLASAVAPADAEAQPDEELAARVEQRVRALVAAGADEGELRALVRDAVDLGRQR